MRTDNKQNKKKRDSVKAMAVRININEVVRKLLIRGENRRKCSEYCSKMLAGLVPQSEIEKILAEKIIFLGWKLERLIKIETVTLSKMNGPIKDLGDCEWINIKKIRRVRSLTGIRFGSPEVKLLHSQIIAVEKAFTKALDQYRQEQDLYRPKNAINS